MTSKTLLSSKLTLLTLLVMAVLLSRLKFKQYLQNREVESEKQKILSQIETLQKKNQEITDSLDYFKSEGFKQRVAREQLNLKQQDEQVFSFKTGAQDQQDVSQFQQLQVSNPEKWINYFTSQSF